jgi:HlyD family secretion protein
MLRPSTPLQHALQRALGWLRRPGAQRSSPISGSPATPPSGDSTPITFGRAGHTPIPPAASTPPASTPAAPAPRSGATTLGGTSSGAGASSGGSLAPNPFRNAGLSASPGGPAAPWSFSQTVLLRKQRSGASVLMWTGIGGVALLGLWAITAPLAETIAVQGKLEPSSSTKRIDTPVPGVVEAVLVKEGQAVRKGDPLVRFDLREPRSRLEAAESVRQRLLNENQIAASTLGDAAATARLSPNQRLQLASQAEEFASRREGALQELRKAQERLAGERASLATYRNIANRYAGLVAKGAASEVQLLEARQNVQKSESTVAQEQREIARLQSSLINTGASTNVELRRKVEENLRQIAELDSDIRLARQQIQFGLLTAPADGTVFDIEVSPGSVVAQGTGTSANASGKSLMKVVPRDALQARVYLPNQAIGFVQPGQRADLQIQAFDASDFGTVPAVVQRIGSDALPAEEQKRELGTDSSGLFYPAVMRLERQTIQLPNSTAPLQAGMSLTANIKLRERRFINIFTGFFDDQRRNLERLR